MGQRHQIELTPKNWECLQDLAQKFEPKTSVTAHANAAVKSYIAQTQEKGDNAVNPKKGKK